MSSGTITVTDGRNSMDIPFREGEMALAAIKRAVKLFSPCQGNGTCGRCIIEVLQPDGSYKRELACRYPAKEMTVRLPALRPVPTFNKDSQQRNPPLQGG